MSSRDKTVFQLASAILLEVSLSLKAPLPCIFKILFKTISTKWRHFFKILFSQIIKSYCNFIKTEQLNTFDNLQLNSMGAHNSSESTESIVHALTLLSRKQEEYTDYRNIRSLKVLNCGDITWSRESNTRQQHTHTHTHLFNGPLSWTTWVSRYQKGKTNLDFTEATDSEWQWHQLGHMQVCTLLQTDNRASTPPLSFLQAGCPSCRPTNSVKALKANTRQQVK